MIKFYNSSIIKILPQVLINQPEVKVLAIVLSNQIKKIIELTQKIKIWIGISNLSDKILDILAIELRTPSYDENFDISIKRKMILNTLEYYKYAGTAKAVTDLITDIFGSGYVKEWYEYGGQPFYFKASTTNPAITDENAQKFIDTVSNMKRLSSWLEAIELELSTESTSINFGFVIHTATKNNFKMR